MLLPMSSAQKLFFSYFLRFIIMFGKGFGGQVLEILLPLTAVDGNCMFSFSYPHSVLKSYSMGGTINDKSSLLRLSAVGWLEGPSSALWALTHYRWNYIA